MNVKTVAGQAPLTSPVGSPTPSPASPASPSAASRMNRGLLAIDSGLKRANDFPDINTPLAERKGFPLMKFEKSRLVELEGLGNLEKAQAILAPMGLEPVPTPSGHARVSIGSMRYGFFGGRFKPAEVWVAVIAKKIGDNQPTGHAYLHTVSDSTFMKLVGVAWGIPYERTHIAILAEQQDSPNVVTITSPDGKAYAGLVRAPELPTQKIAQEVDFPAFSPTGKTMAVHIEGNAETRPYDPAADKADFGAATEIGKILKSLGFLAKRWVSHDAAEGAIRAGA